MTFRSWFVFACCIVPPTYLTVLLLFDVKYFDSTSLAYTVPVYPFPVYLKAVLGVMSCCVVAVLGIMNLRKP